MKMRVLTYGGPDPSRVSTLREEAGVPGHTRFDGGQGQGLTGARAGTRAWPGSVSLCFSVVEDELAISAAEHCRSAQLPPGERLHVAVVPVESFQ